MGAKTNFPELLYRGLSREAYQDYCRSGTLQPYSGSLTAGTAVCFSNRLETALQYAKSGTLIVTSRELIDPEGDAVDTRVTGYEKPFEKQLDNTKGEGNYDGYELWAAIQRQDNILDDGNGGYIYARREAVIEDEILEVMILETREQEAEGAI